MTMTQRQTLIYNYIIAQWSCKMSELVDHFEIERTTIYRDLRSLIKQWYIVSPSKWVYKIKIRAQDYLKLPTRERTKLWYDYDFLASYIPNQTSFFTAQQLKQLEQYSNNIALDTNFYKTNKRLLEIIMIDLSFSSSSLEGNTYSQLDTEVLIKYKEIAQDKSKEETTMILNHKQCIEYMIWYKNEIWYNKQTFYEIHQLLGKDLLPDSQIGIIRSQSVEIWWSVYSPLDNPHTLMSEFELFLTKLNQIINPFEQSIFIMIFIPYFQLFMDINKRTSRMSCNLPLLKHNLPLISLLAISPRDYITAILAVYELQDTSLLAQLYTDNYLLNAHRYQS